MRDKQNPAAVNDETLPVEDEQSRLGKNEEAPRSYYYDDATGYEIYEDADDDELDEQAGSVAEESQT